MQSDTAKENTQKLNIKYPEEAGISKMLRTPVSYLTIQDSFISFRRKTHKLRGEAEASSVDKKTELQHKS